MNVFDVGGVVSFVALVISFLLGIGIYVLLNSFFEITHFGFGALIGFFFSCVVAGALIVNFLAGLLGGVISVVWGLLKIIAIIAIIGYLIMFIYNKISGKNQKEQNVNE